MYGGFRHNGGERWGEREKERRAIGSWERAFDQAAVSPRSSAQRWDGIINDGMQMKSNRLFGDRERESQADSDCRRLLAKAPLGATEPDKRRKRDRREESTVTEDN